MTTVLQLLTHIEDELRNNNKPSTQRAASTVAAVIASNLLYRCYEITRMCKSIEASNELDKLMPIGSNSLLPPLTDEQIRRRIQWMKVPNTHTQLTVTIPRADPQKPFKRSGLIMRQHMVHGEVTSLFVAGVENDSPASRAENLKYGDRILAVNNIPLDFLTLEQSRCGLLESVDPNELDGLPENLFDLASYLLNQPYRTGTQGSTAVTVIVARKPENSRRPTLCDKGEQNKVLSSICHETVVQLPSESVDLGLELAVDKNENGVQIMSILPGSAADIDGTLNPGDRIIEVNYQSLESMSPQDALRHVTRQCGKTKCVQLKTISTVLKSQQSSQDEHAIPPNPRRYSSSTANSFDRPSIGSYTLSAGDLMQPKRSSRCSEIVDHWRERVSSEFQIVVAEYDIENSSYGLGLSIESEIDSDSGEQHHFIVDIAKEATVNWKTLLQTGDELLQLNSSVLYGCSHLEVAKKLHEFPLRGQIICARLSTTPPTTTTPKTQSPEIVISPKDLPSNQLDEVTTEKHKNTDTLVDAMESSDIDEYPQSPHILLPRVGRSSRSSTVVSTNQTTSDEDDENECSMEKENLENLEENYATHLEVQGYYRDSGNSNGFDRLPMAAHKIRVDVPDNVMGPEPQSNPKNVDRSQDFRHVFASSKHPMRQESTRRFLWYDEKNNCMGLRVHKEAGQFLGLDLEATDGGPNGIRVACVIDGSVLDQLRQRLVHSNYRFLSAGDQVISVAGYSCKNVCGFSVRSLLRRLVFIKRDIVILYLPREWIKS